MHMRGQKKEFENRHVCFLFFFCFFGNAFYVYAFHMMCERCPKKKNLAAIVKGTFPGKTKKLEPPMCKRIMCERREKGKKGKRPFHCSSRDRLENLRLPVSMLSVLQSVVLCCSVLQRVAVCCTFQLPSSREYFENLVCCSVLYCVAACCSVLQCVAVCCSVLQCVAPSNCHRRGNTSKI